MMSRPLPSAPRKNRPPALNHCGPIGVPLNATTLTVLPPSLRVSVRWFWYASVWATPWAHSGAARATATSRTNRPRNPSATLLRRRRRIAGFHGPTPAGCSRRAPSSKPPAWGPETVADSVATLGRLYARRERASPLPAGPYGYL